jgi:hypothetical protein
VAHSSVGVPEFPQGRAQFHGRGGPWVSQLSFWRAQRDTHVPLRAGGYWTSREYSGERSVTFDHRDESNSRKAVEIADRSKGRIHAENVVNRPSDPASHRRTSGLAVQRGMGILPERRVGPAVDHPDCSGFRPTRLTRPAAAAAGLPYSPRYSTQFSTEGIECQF